MRKVAGILLVGVGLFLLVTFAFVPGDPDGYDAGFNLFVATASTLIVAGGVFCILRKVWGLCLASSLVALLITIIWSGGLHYVRSLAWLAWLLSVAGVLPVIFVSIKKKEWKRTSEVSP